MKKVEQLLKGKKYVAFVDFEGTQFSHEMIAIGAVLATLDRNGRIKELKQPFKTLVRAKNKVGNFVSEMTQITDEMLKGDGVSFYDALVNFKKYLGTKWKKCIFVTFGNHDMRILNQSIAYNFNYPKDITSQFHKNYADFATFFGEFVRDDKGNNLSLIHGCELFEVPLAEPAHDPESDAINLARLYDAFVAKQDLVIERYKMAVLQTNHFPDPVRKLVESLNNGESVTPEQYDKLIKEYLK